MIEDQPRAIPHSLISEKAVISAIFNNPDLLADAQTLTEDHFHLPGPRYIYRNLLAMAAAGKPFDVLILLQTSLDNGTLERIGGPAEIKEVMNYEIDSMRFPHHMEMLTDRLARRMAIKAAQDIFEAVYDQDTITTLLEATSAPITAIHDTLLAAKPAETMEATVIKVLSDLDKRIRGEVSSMGIATGIELLDRKLRGIHKGQTMVISGYPSGGKSLLAGQFCAEAFKEGRNTLFVSLEMSRETIVNRLTAYVAGVEGRAITDPREYAKEKGAGSLTKHELIKIQRAAKDIYAAPFDIERLLGANEQLVAAVIRKHHRKRPLDVVVIDFAQRLRPSAEVRSQTREQQLSHASKVFADLAQELGFALILLSQLNKEGAAKHAEALNEDCDVHLQIAQDPKTKEHQGIGVPKDRHNGQAGAFYPIKLNEAFIRFEEDQPGWTPSC